MAEGHQNDKVPWLKIESREHVLSSIMTEPNTISTSTGENACGDSHSNLQVIANRVR